MYFAAVTTKRKMQDKIYVTKTQRPAAQTDKANNKLMLAGKEGQWYLFFTALWKLATVR